MLAGDSDGWGEPESSSTLRRPKAPPEVVRDDWEDEEEEEAPVEEKNKRIWDKANHEAAAPMPAFVVSSSSRSVVSPPPAAAFQPALKILKRPANNQSNSSTSTPAVSKESLEDREARYQAARQRIFGDDTTSAGSEASTYHLASKKDNSVIRNPRGPDETVSTDATPSKGFSSRATRPSSADSG
ncbi:hypothetical protein GYMLUDRAFT_35696 [Collybiopsis luxurians FD-317 M1]|nr:hypothetical protein GYMLUDRAFT_35696 [Collybiopsis luxurians FD-317 M1]